MRRLPGLDVLRGFALCGILFANAPAILRLHPVRDGALDPVPRVLELVVYGRFFPLFSLLFGIGFALMWRSARCRAAAPRVVLLRRILALAALGALHQLLQPGEALLPYAIVGLTLLLPSTFLPRRWAAPATGVAGALLTVAGAALGGGLVLVPGLFLLGFAAGLADLPRRLESVARHVLPMAALALGPAAAAGVLWQLGHPEAGAAVGLIMAATYACLVLSLSRTTGFAVMAALLAALGRTALTNYVAATLIVVGLRVAARPLGIGPDAPRAWSHTVVLCVLILVVQGAVSRWWLSRFDQGPLEWLLRKASWAGAAPAVRAGSAAAA
ncbi:DUF418 domain-containing protein [Nocardia sp. CC227C]|uniref:DUF418 domain-containing protein n=1 Tax=Nocardia sp. CC227C TaxID=3044562 RepID=UPI00278C1D88|nr:DUF418 domain-containing protein [Nocardia sp. CC227C]